MERARLLASAQVCRSGVISHAAMPQDPAAANRGDSCGVRSREFRPEKCEIDNFYTFPQKTTAPAG
jgi:hypothetical protein